MSQGGHSEPLLRLALFYQSTPSCLKVLGWWWGGGPCDFSVSPSPFGLDFGTLDFGTSDSGLTIMLVRKFLDLLVFSRGQTQTNKVIFSASWHHCHCDRLWYLLYLLLPTNYRACPGPRWPGTRHPHSPGWHSALMTLFTQKPLTRVRSRGDHFTILTSSYPQGRKLTPHTASQQTNCLV